jgi:hypothetical protein
MPRRTKKSSFPPAPPVLDGLRVLKFAHIARPITYSGRSGLIVISPSGKSKEIGPVPCLAIADTLRHEREFVILHCGRTWKVAGAQGGFSKLRDAEGRAERMYPGVSRAWVETKTTRREAKKIELEQWKPFRCSFCGRVPPEFGPKEGGVILGKGVAICRDCITAFYESFQDSPAK